MALATVIAGPSIAAGQSLSAALDVSAGTIARVAMPLQWTSAPLTVQLSPDNVTFYDLFERNGKEFIIEVIPGAMILLSADFTQVFQWIKFRSGTRANPINQAAKRDFKCILAA